MPKPASKERKKPKEEKGERGTRRAEPAPMPPEPIAARFSYLSPKEMFSSIKGLGLNWDEECEKMLSPPEPVLRTGSASSSYFSGDGNFSIIQVARSLAAGSPSLPDATYGLAIEEKARSVYVTFADSGRRIIVRMRMVSYGEEPPQRDWADFKAAMRAALDMASSDEAKRDNLVAVHDGLLKLVSPSETFGMLRSPPSVGIMRGNR